MRIALVVTVIAATSITAANARTATPPPLVTVVRHGGLCAARTECRTVLRITDTTISGQGYISRRLTPAARTALLRAIRMLDLRYLRAHPFKGVCPTAYDGAESTYRFRGFSTALPSCTYDLRGVGAVQLTERLLAPLKRR